MNKIFFLYIQVRDNGVNITYLVKYPFFSTNLLNISTEVENIDLFWNILQKFWVKMHLILHSSIPNEKLLVQFFQVTLSFYILHCLKHYKSSMNLVYLPKEILCGFMKPFWVKLSKFQYQNSQRSLDTYNYANIL